MAGKKTTESLDMPPMGVVVGSYRNAAGDAIVYMRYWDGDIDDPKGTRLLFDMTPDFAVELAGLMKKEAKKARNLRT